MLTSSNFLEKKIIYRIFFIACVLWVIIYPKSAIFQNLTYFIILKSTRINVNVFIFCAMKAGNVTTFLKQNKLGSPCKILRYSPLNVSKIAPNAI